MLIGMPLKYYGTKLKEEKNEKQYKRQKKSRILDYSNPASLVKGRKPIVGNNKSRLEYLMWLER